MKRRLINEGLNFAYRVGLAEIHPSTNGIEFRATEDAPGLLALIDAAYYRDLASRAQWVCETFSEVSDPQLREKLTALFGERSEEFGSANLTKGLETP